MLEDGSKFGRRDGLEGNGVPGCACFGDPIWRRFAGDERARQCQFLAASAIDAYRHQWPNIA
jgi:hypothetical protein